MRALGLAFLILIGTAVESARACVVPFIRTLNNQTVDGSMTVGSGKPCSIVLQRSGGPTDRVEIVQRPSSGTVTIGGGTRVIYRSRPGFVGRDSFVYARHGRDTGNNPVTRTVRIAVTVTP